MRFEPYVLDRSLNRVPASIVPMTAEMAERTTLPPRWQTSWISNFISDSGYDKYAVVAGDELVGLGAYEILENLLVVHIVYMEAQPESNPTMDQGDPKYDGIGKLLVAFGIKLSIDNGLTGDVVLEAKTTSLEKHYVKDFGAVKLPQRSSSAPRYLISDEAAKRIFFSYLVE